MSDLYQTPVIHRPSLEELEKIATELGFNINKEDSKGYKDVISELADGLDKIEKFPEPTLQVKYPRLPGYRPSSSENKYNAWYYKTEIHGASSGKLKGKTIALKDTITLAGVPMMNGSNAMRGYRPDVDATVVTRILDEGGTISGKAVCNDLCYSKTSCTAATGTVLNPLDSSWSAGGSSSGSAALVAGGEVDMALGGDQGGSIRSPAAWCGIVGLKPTFGLVPYTGIAGADPTLDHVGPMTRTVYDCALLLEVIAGYDGGLDSRQTPDVTVKNYTDMLDGDIKGMKMGVIEEMFEGTDKDIASILRMTIKNLTELGATVESLSYPPHKLTDDHIFTEGTHYNIINSGCAVGQKGYHNTHLTDFLFKSFTASGFRDIAPTVTVSNMAVSHMEKTRKLHSYSRSQNIGRKVRDDYSELLKKYDVLLMPTVKVKPKKALHAGASVKELWSHRSAPDNCGIFNVTGHPAVSVNAGFAGKYPAPLQLVGRHFEDGRVLKVAHVVETLAKTTQADEK